jgi:hypothetical protein
MPRNLAHEAKRSPLTFQCRRRADTDGPDGGERYFEICDILSWKIIFKHTEY